MWPGPGRVPPNLRWKDRHLAPEKQEAAREVCDCLLKSRAPLKRQPWVVFDALGGLRFPLWFFCRCQQGLQFLRIGVGLDRVCNNDVRRTHVLSIIGRIVLVLYADRCSVERDAGEQPLRACECHEISRRARVRSRPLQPYRNRSVAAKLDLVRQQ